MTSTATTTAITIRMARMTKKQIHLKQIRQWFRNEVNKISEGDNIPFCSCSSGRLDSFLCLLKSSKGKSVSKAPREEAGECSTYPASISVFVVAAVCSILCTLSSCSRTSVAISCIICASCVIVSSILRRSWFRVCTSAKAARAPDCRDWTS